MYTFPVFGQQDTIQKKMPSDKQLLILARQYKYGIIREANPNKAVKIYNYLARKNNTDAIDELGKCYLHGDGVEKNVALAQKLFLKAAKLGNLNAICNLALLYQKGFNGIINYKKAYTLYKMAAKAGSVQGIYGAGYLLYKGLGVTQDYAKAVNLLERGAEKGHSGCCLLLASYYANGYDNGQDIDKANKYWRKASRNGNSWTVDVTKIGLTDSIKKRMNHKGNWTHVKNRVLSEEKMPEIKSSTNANEIEGSWKGKAYRYDWSRKNIMTEQDIMMNIKCNDDSVHIDYYAADSLVTAYSTVRKGSKYISKKITDEQKSFSWTVTQTLFEAKGDYLYVDLKVLNLESMSVSRPLFAILTRNSNEGASQTTTFDITSIKYKSGEISVNINASKAMDVDITVTTISGLVRLPTTHKELRLGHNTLTIPISFNNGDVAGIVSVIHKNERHSKAITVINHE